MSTIVRASSGITGLDEVLHEGYVAESAHLLSGRPGTGKTTLGWHFLTAGRAADGLSMFITLGEPAGVLKTNAARTGFNPEEVEFLDLSPSSDLFVDNKS